MSSEGALRELTGELIEDYVLDLIFSEHRKAKLSRRTCGHCGQTCRDFGPQNRLLFGTDPPASSETIKCDVCQKNVGPGMFAKHLEKCMGLQGARGANRRNPNKSYAEDQESSPEKKRKKPSVKKSKVASLSADSPVDNASSTSASSVVPLNGKAPASEAGEAPAKPKKPPAKRRKKADGGTPSDAPGSAEKGSGATAASGAPGVKKKSQAGSKLSKNAATSLASASGVQQKPGNGAKLTQSQQNMFDLLSTSTYA